MYGRGLMPLRHLRRFPVYLLLDCSGSMLGEPITALNEGLEIIYRQLIEDPQALEIVHICLIPFADSAELGLLEAVDEFTPPKLVASGKTALGAALLAMMTSIEEDLLPNTSEHKGDYRPLAFLITDGAPTDDYRKGIDYIRALTRLKPLIIALGCGPEADMAVLQEIAGKENTFFMQTLAPDTLKKYCKWVTDAIVVSSHAIERGGESGTVIASPAQIPGIAPGTP